MDTIPSEILLDILNRLDLQSRLNLSLVSKAMRAVTRRLILSFGFPGDSSRKDEIELLRKFSNQFLLDPSLTSQVRSVKLRSTGERYIGELHGILEPLLKRCPNIRRLEVKGGRETAEFFQRLLTNESHLHQLQSFENYHCSAWRPDEDYLQSWRAIFGLERLSSISLFGSVDRMYRSGVPDIPLELQVIGELSLRHIRIRQSYLGYTILARLIRSCKSLETFIYEWPEDFCPGDSDPATILDALSLHKDSLKVLICDFRSRDHAEHEEYDRILKIGSLEEFSCLEAISITHDCLPVQPLLPPSLKTLDIKLSCRLPERVLIQNLARASHSSLSKLRTLNLKHHLKLSPKGISKGFHKRVKVTHSDYFRVIDG